MPEYICKWCGQTYNNLSYLTSGRCYDNPYGDTHEVYPPGKRSKYQCKYCGKEDYTIPNLTRGRCYGSGNPNKKHEIL